MPIIVNLDVMLAKRKMSVTELSERVGITMANLSILKTGRRRRSVSRRSKPFARRSIASPGTFWSIEVMKGSQIRE